jgi:hypothetical protein
MLLPVPKKLRQLRGTLKLPAGCAIVLAPESDDREVLAARDLAAEAAAAGGRMSVERMARTGGIGVHVLVAVAGRDDRFDRRVALLGRALRAAPKTVREQAYALTVDVRGAVVVGGSPVGAFYGLQTLRQMLRPGRRGAAALPRVRVIDWPDYRWRGVMLDVSRFKVATLETLREIVDRLAHLKINVLQFNMEHVFAYRRHPAIGRGCDPYTPEDIIELDRYCRERCVDFQANLQSFGHCEHILTRPEYRRLAENPKKPWSLSPVDEGAYLLLDDMYAELLPCHSGTLFNADCDETHDLGRPDSRSGRLAKRVGVGRVYLQHIKRINGLARKYGKRMMIWGDIVLKHPELIPEVPGDVLLLNWGYGQNHKFETTWKFKRARREHWVCPGTSAWQAVWPLMEKACLNIERFAAVGARTGATGLLNTDWGDHGHFQVQGASFHGFAYGAEQSWTAEARPRVDFDRRFAWAWFRDGSGRFGRLWRAMNGTNMPWFGDKAYDRMIFRLYFDKFPDGEYIERAEAKKLTAARRAARAALAMIPAIESDFPEHSVTLQEARLAAQESLLAVRKAELGQRVAAAREAGRPLGQALRRNLRDLLAEWDRQRIEFERVWLLRARRSQMAYRLGLYRRGRRQMVKALTGK